MKELKQPKGLERWKRFQVGNRTKESTILTFVNSMGLKGWEFVAGGRNREGKYRIFHFRSKPYKKSKQ